MKTKTIIIITTLTLCIMLSSANGFADVPAPPANQSLGIFDGSIGSLEEADCRICHSSGVPDRHHMLYGSVIPSLSLVPYPDSDGDGVDDTNYSCLSCHDENFTVVRDCAVCHDGPSPHHQTASADAGNCTACHGDLVDNMGDGHYIPTYAPSLVTPKRSQGDGDPLNSRGNGAGACNYCHDDDGQTTPVILTNVELHHGINLVDFGSRCDWCHGFALPFEEQIRVCEGCHGPDSLHNIQTDSNGDGLVVVGGEDAGYGHVGRDAGPSDSDCWGCHGFGTSSASAPVTGPTTPYLSDTDKQVILTGTDTSITLSGSSLINTSGTTEYVSTFALTAQDGSVTVLTPDHININNSSSATLIIPGTIPAGNYKLLAAKSENIFTWVVSNPVPISIKEPLVILAQSVTQSCGECSGELTITGSGFGIAPPEGSEEFMNVMQNDVPLDITSWDGGVITATGAVCDGSEITVNGLFGSATK